MLISTQYFHSNIVKTRISILDIDSKPHFQTGCLYMILQHKQFSLDRVPKGFRAIGLKKQGSKAKTNKGLFRAPVYRHIQYIIYKHIIYKYIIYKYIIYKIFNMERESFKEYSEAATVEKEEF